MQACAYIRAHTNIHTHIRAYTHASHAYVHTHVPSVAAQELASPHSRNRKQGRRLGTQTRGGGGGGLLLLRKSLSGRSKQFDPHVVVVVVVVSTVVPTPQAQVWCRPADREGRAGRPPTIRAECRTDRPRARAMLPM